MFRGILMDVTIRQNKNVADSPAFFLVLEGAAAMNRSKILPRQDDQLDVAHTSVTYAVNGEGSIVGVLCTRPAEATNTLIMTMAYVAPEARRKGVFKKLLRYVEEHAAKKGYRSLSMHVASDNQVGADLLEATGYQVGVYIMEKRLT